jgi:predicted aspartyl protease
MTTHSLRILLLAFTTVLLFPLFAGGEVYQYEDDGGTVHFVDDPGKIPKKYIKKQKVREGSISEPGGSVTRIRIIGNSVVVPVTIAYRGTEVRANFLLDTGASTCTISPGLAKRLRINPDEGDRGYAQGIGGGVYLVGRAKLDYIIAGPNRRYDIDVSVVQSGQFDGLLGMNFLRELRYHIDFDSSAIKWGD